MKATAFRLIKTRGVTRVISMLYAKVTKVTAIFTLVCFVWSSCVAEAVYGAMPGPDPLQTRVKGSLDDFVLPYSLGKITGAYRGGSEKIVIHIQDLHCHPEVQRNIARILGILDQRYDVSKVFIEGGTGPLDTSWINKVGDPRLREEMLEGFLNSGRLTGSEYYSIKSGKYTLLAGLEDEGLYFDNLKRLDTIRNGRGSLEAKYPAIDNAFAALKKQYYSKANRHFDKLLAQHEAGTVRGEAYYRLLMKTARKAGVRLSWYPELQSYSGILAMQKRLNYRKVSSQMTACLAVLREKIPYESYAGLMAVSQDPARMSELYVRLERLVREKGLTVPAGSGQLNLFFNYVEANQNMDPLALDREEKELVRELHNRFSLTAAEQEITFLADFFECIKAYLENRISADDYDHLVKAMPVFRRTWEKYTAPNSLLGLADHYELLDKYYAVNLERNKAFLRNTFGSLPPRETSPGNSGDRRKEVLELLRSAREVKVLVTGGFHTRGMEELYRRYGVSYLIITPDITGEIEPARRNYDRIVAAQVREIAAQTLAAYCLTNTIEREELEIKLEAARIPPGQRARWIDRVLDNTLKEEFLKEKIAGDYEVFNGSDEEFVRSVRSGLAELSVSGVTVTAADHLLTITGAVTATVPLHRDEDGPRRKGRKQPGAILHGIVVPLLLIPFLASTGFAFDPVVIFAGVGLTLFLGAAVPTAMTVSRHNAGTPGIGRHFRYGARGQVREQFRQHLKRTLPYIGLSVALGSVISSALHTVPAGISVAPAALAVAGIGSLFLLRAVITPAVSAPRRARPHVTTKPFSGSHGKGSFRRWVLGTVAMVLLSLMLTSSSAPAGGTNAVSVAPPAAQSVALQTTMLREDLAGMPRQIVGDEEESNSHSTYVPPPEPPILDKVYPTDAARAQGSPFSYFMTAWDAIEYFWQLQFSAVATDIQETAIDVMYSGSRLIDRVSNAEEHQVEVEEWIDFLNDRDNEIMRRQAVEMLGEIPYNETAVNALIDVLAGKYGDEPEMRDLAIAALVDIGDREVIAPLERAIAALQKEGQDSAALRDTLAMMKERIQLRAEIKALHGITVRDFQETRFDVYQLRAIKDFLNAYELPTDVSYIQSFRPTSAESGDGANGWYSSGNGSGGAMIRLQAAFSGESMRGLYVLLFHEFAHSLDNKYFYFDAFGEFHVDSKLVDNASQWLKRYADYAQEYGTKNKNEDFATVAESYGNNAAGHFLEAIGSAERGRPLFLEKLLYVADLFSLLHPDHTVLYEVSGEGVNSSLRYREVPVTRDVTGLKTIDGIAIYNPDGSYNLAGLKQYFESVKVDQTGPALNPRSPYRAPGMILPLAVILSGYAAWLSRKARRASAVVVPPPGGPAGSGRPGEEATAFLEAAATRAADLSMKPRSMSEEGAVRTARELLAMNQPAHVYAPTVAKNLVGIIPSGLEGSREALRHGRELAAMGFDVVVPLYQAGDESRRDVRRFSAGGSLTVIRADMSAREILTAVAEGRAWGKDERVDAGTVRPFSLILWADAARKDERFNPNVSGKSEVRSVHIVFEEGIQLDRLEQLFTIRNTMPAPDAETYYYATPANKDELSAMTAGFMRSTVLPVARVLVIDLTAANLDTGARDVRDMLQKVITAGQRAGVNVLVGVNTGHVKAMPAGFMRFLAEHGAGLELVCDPEAITGSGREAIALINDFYAALDRIPVSRCSVQLPGPDLANRELSVAIHEKGLRVSVKRSLGDQNITGSADILYIDGDRETIERMSSQELQARLDELDSQYGLGVTDRLNRLLALIGYGSPVGDAENPAARLRSKISLFIDRHEFSRGYRAGFAKGAKMPRVSDEELRAWARNIRQLNTPAGSREAQGYSRGQIEAQLVTFHLNFLAEQERDLAARLIVELAVEHGQALDLSIVSSSEAFALKIDKALEGWPSQAAHPRFNEAVLKIRGLRDNPELFGKVSGPAIEDLKELIAGGVLDNRPEKPAAIAALVYLIELFGEREFTGAFDEVAGDAFDAMMAGVRATLQAA